MLKVESVKPTPEEYPKRYQRYIDNVPETDVFTALLKQNEETQSFLEGISEQQSLSRYQKGKWSIREVIGHIIDVERIFSLRVLRFSRGDNKPRQDFDFDKTTYVLNGRYHQQLLAELSDEFLSLRRANLHLITHLQTSQLSLTGEANNDRLTVLALLFVILGHERHHLKAIANHYLEDHILL